MFAQTFAIGFLSSFALLPDQKDMRLFVEGEHVKIFLTIKMSTQPSLIAFVLFILQIIILNIQ